MKVTKKKTVEESLDRFFMGIEELKIFFLPEDIYYTTIYDGIPVEYIFIIPSKFSDYLYEDRVAYDYMRYNKKYIVSGTNKEFGMPLQNVHGNKKIFKLIDSKIIRNITINEILN